MSETLVQEETAPYVPNFSLWRDQIEAGRTGEGGMDKKEMATQRKLQGTAFEEWINRPDIWDGNGCPALNSPEWHVVHDSLKMGVDIIGDPWRAALTSWAMTSTRHTKNKSFDTIVGEAMKDPEQFHYYTFLSNMLEALGQTLAYGENKNEDLRASKLFNREQPDKATYRTLSSDGETWRDLDTHELAAMMRDPNGPHIIMAGNHAFLETLNEKLDLKPVVTNFSELYAKVLEKDGGPTLSAWDKPGLGPNDTIMVCATHTRENKFLNLAQLFRRLADIEKFNATDEEKALLADPTTPDVVKEEIYNKPQADTFENSAPIALQMVETIMESIVADKDVGRIRTARNTDGKPEFFDRTQGPVTVRDDALDTIRRTTYFGYSKAGNDFRDGMRLLVHELNAVDASGKRVVQLPMGMTTRDIVNNIAMSVTGLNEHELDQYYVDNGIAMNYYSNKQDTIAAASKFSRNKAERVSNYAGSPSNAGHSPMHVVNGILNGAEGKGGRVKEWRAKDELRMQWATTIDKAAIACAHLVANEDGTAKLDRLEFEVAPGTSDAMMEASRPLIMQSLQAAGLEHFDLVRKDQHDTTRYELHSTDESQPLITPENITRIKAGLVAVAATENTPIFVAQSVTMEKLNVIKGELLHARKEGRAANAVTIDGIVEAANRIGVIDHPRSNRNKPQNPRINSTGTSAVGLG